MSQPGTDPTSRAAVAVGQAAVAAGQAHRALAALRNSLAAHDRDALLWGAVCAIDAARILLGERAGAAALDPAARLACDPPWPGPGSLAEAVSAARAAVLAAAMAAREAPAGGMTRPSAEPAALRRPSRAE